MCVSFHLIVMPLFPAREREKEHRAEGNKKFMRLEIKAKLEAATDGWLALGLGAEHDAFPSCL